MTQYSSGAPAAARFGREVLPGPAAVPGELDLAVVRAGPDEARLERRFRDRRQRAELDVARELLRVVRRQVGRDLPPVVAAVERAEQDLGAEIDDPAVVGERAIGAVQLNR